MQRFLPSPTVSTIREAMVPDADGAYVLWVGESAPLDLEELVAGLWGTRFIGGVVPRVIFGGETFDDAVVIQRFSCTEMFLATPARDADWTDRLPHPDDLLSRSAPITVAILVDAFSGVVNDVLHRIFDRYGTNVAYFGAGCGRSSLQSESTILFPGVTSCDAVAIAFIEADYVGSSSHGLVPREGPVIATGTRGPTITHLNWRPAVDVYRELLTEQGVVLPADPLDFYATATRYPFGMFREALPYLVRDPIAVTEDGGIRCAAEIPKHTVLQVLGGDPYARIESAAENLNGPGVPFTVTCESRSTLLGAGFEREIRDIDAVVDGSHLGVTAYGEISSRRGHLEFLNKTAVFSRFVSHA